LLLILTIEKFNKLNYIISETTIIDFILI